MIDNNIIDICKIFEDRERQLEIEENYRYPEDIIDEDIIDIFDWNLFFFKNSDEKSTRIWIPSNRNDKNVLLFSRMELFAIDNLYQDE